MNEKFQRIIPYFGEETFNKLQNKCVLVLGLGGVGGYVVDGLIRCGVKKVGICDGDKVEYSNFNRQIIATMSNLGKQKVIGMKERILDISDDVLIDEYDFFIDEKTIDDIDFKKYDLIIDCIDGVKAKLLIIEKAKENNIEIISSMGTANKQDPNGFKIVDINQTSYCPLAKKIRLELRKKNISKVKVCFSNEEVHKTDIPLASLVYVVASASYVIVKEAIDILTK